jgi:hypothetical protein
MERSLARVRQLLEERDYLADEVELLKTERDDLRDAMRYVLNMRVAGCSCCNPDLCSDCDDPCPWCRAKSALAKCRQT